jgi:hypothetical protein
MRVCDREKARSTVEPRLLRPLRDELFPLSAKLFWVLGATVLKLLRGTGCANVAPEKARSGRSKQIKQ